MIPFKKTLMCSLFALGVCSAVAPSMAQDTSYAPLYDVYPLYRADSAQVPHLTAEQVQELRFYLEYEEREPYQNYLPVPDGFVRQGCDLMVPYTIARPVVRQTTTTQVVQQERTVLADYEIHFAFDSAAIEPQANDMLDKIASEINTYHPGEVTVAGHADRSGPADYNVNLSQRRADAVSQALTARGVTNRVIDEQALGESDPAVPTPDGVKLRENRRVEVQFLK